MGIIYFWYAFNHILSILKYKKYQKRGLLLTYIIIKIKELSFIKVMKLKINIESIFGFRISFNDYQTFVFLFEEIFILKEYYFNNRKQNPLIIDCGSNIGMSILYFKTIYPNARIIGFEPYKEHFNLLKKNIKINKLKSISIFNKAVSNKIGKINLYYNSTNTSNISVIDNIMPNKTILSVDTVLLSSFIKDEVDLLKLDIEGAEDLVFQDMYKNKKLRLIKNIILEYHHHLIHNEDKLSKILKILEENDFGYQMSTFFKPPFSEKKVLQNILIFAYRK